jgi:hypothetical protein
LDSSSRPELKVNDGEDNQRKINYLRSLFRFGMPSLQSLLRTLLMLVGLGLVISSLLRSWFDIPVAANGGVEHFDEICAQSPNCQIYFQVLMASGLICLASSWFFQKCRWSILSSLVACSMIFVGLAFPYFVMLRSPVIAADATWLQMQHDNLTWLGGDINSAAEAGQMAWKSKVYWVDPPRQVAVAPLPNWSAWDAGLDKTDDLLIWFGYSNVFCQFVRAGWFHALIGSCILALVTLLRRGPLNLPRAGYAIVFLSSLIVVGATIALSGPFRVKAQLNDAASAMCDGDYQQALNQLHRCSELFPALTQDTHYISQRALLENELQINSDYAKLFRAVQDESAGRYDQAFQAWHLLCDSGDAAIRREALRAMLRFAIQDYNSNRFSLARERLEFVLFRQPANVKAIYFRQILGVREKNAADVYLMCDWMYAVTDHLNFSSTKILKAVSQQNAKMAAAQDGDEAETWVRTIGARKP